MENNPDEYDKREISIAEIMLITFSSNSSERMEVNQTRDGERRKSETMQWKGKNTIDATLMQNSKRQALQRKSISCIRITLFSAKCSH